jgi:hypothetical protein
MRKEVLETEQCLLVVDGGSHAVTMRLVANDLPSSPRRRVTIQPSHAPCWEAVGQQGAIRI